MYVATSSAVTGLRRTYSSIVDMLHLISTRAVLAKKVMVISIDGPRNPWTFDFSIEITIIM